MIFSLFSDIVAAKDLYEDVRGLADDVKKGKAESRKRPVPLWVSAFAAVVIVASVLFILSDQFGALASVKVHEPEAVASAEPAAPQPADCARDPFLDACK